MAPIKLGFVGLSAGGGAGGSGSWAKRGHLPYILKSPLYEITALQNSSKASADKALSELQLPGKVATHGDSASFAADSNIDLAVVSVRVPLHYKTIKPALEAKKDIFVEWPLAANLKEAEELTALAKSKGVKTSVGLQARQDPSIRKAREMVQNGELGQILGSTMLGSAMFGGDSQHESFEYGLPIENGANMITIPAGHAMDALCYVLGEFKDLQATLTNAKPKMPIVDSQGNVLRTSDKTSHDWMSVTGNLQKGGVATVVYQSGVSQTGKNFYWEINGTKGSLVLEGPAGHVQMFHPTLKFVKTDHKDSKLEGYKNTKDEDDKHTTLQEVKVDHVEPMDFSYNVGKSWDAFAGKGDGALVPFEDALVRHKMIDAIYRSNENGTRESYI